MLDKLKLDLKKNWKSGLTVALISIPLSISLGVASGVSPIAGIITAIWASFIASLFGGSNYNIIGPTGALSGIIASYAFIHGIESVSSIAIISGFFVLLAYILKLERYIIFIPSSVIHGLTLGIAGIIILNQINFAFGLQNLAKHEKLVENVFESLININNISWPTFLIFIIFFIGLIFLRKKIPSVPSVIILSPIGIVIGYATITGLLPFYIETLGTKFGNIEPSLIQVPLFVFNKNFIIPALVIAFIAIIETMLSAKIADTITKTRHNSRKELLGLGLANIASGFAGGIPATAALARTALNIKTGATSSISALLSSIFILLGSFLFLPFFYFMPMAVIAAILVYVSVNMIEREHFDRLFYYDKINFAIALLVAIISIYQDPIIGVLLGSVISLLLLVNKLAESYHDITIHEDKIKNTNLKQNILIYKLKGQLVYLNSQGHLMRFQSDFNQYKTIILVLNDIYFIDLDGIDTLEEIINIIQNRNQVIIIVSPVLHIKNMLYNSKSFKKLENKGLVFDSLDLALNFESKN